MNYGLLTIEVKLPQNFLWPEGGITVNLKAEKSVGNNKPHEKAINITKGIFDGLPQKDKIDEVIKSD